MKNKEKILIALASLSFFLIVYLVIVSKKIETPNEHVVKEQPRLEKVDLVKLKSTYQETVKYIYNGLKRNFDENISTSTAAEDSHKYFLETKKELMSLVVPAEYRPFHLSLVKLIDEAVDSKFVLNKELYNKINKIGEENKWLN